MLKTFGGWTFGGKTVSGDSFYFKLNGELGVEKDFTRLVEPTPDEGTEIYDMFPHLKGASGKEEGVNYAAGL